MNIASSLWPTAKIPGSLSFASVGMTSKDAGSTTVNFPSGDFSAFPAGVLVDAEVLDELLAEDDALALLLCDAVPLPALLHPPTVPASVIARTAVHTVTAIRSFTMQGS
jgi:hypothetical protein